MTAAEERSVGVHAAAIDSALQDLLDAASNRRRHRTFPATIRFYRGPAGVIAAILTKQGGLGFGCARPDVGDAGTFEPTPVWRERARHDLEERTGWRSVLEVTDASGLPPVASIV